ncbi:MAG: universal stress protein [Acidobacteriota bacterium]|jgi:nucleotide-binding universal stress UspA family protein
MNATEPAVLVGTTLTPASDRVVRAAAAVARALGGTVHLVHAVPYPVEFFDDTILSDHVLEDLREREREALLRDVAAQAERNGIGGDLLHGVTVEPGEPHRTLVDVARSLRPDLLVVGAAEDPDHITRAFGSTAGRVLRKATRPVLVVRGDLRLPPGRVLLPVDLSPLSADVARSAADLLRRLGLASTARSEALFVLTERQSLILAAAEDAGAPEEMTRRRLETFTERFLGELAGTVDCALRIGDPADEIVERARETACDLVVLGTHGRSGFERLLIGSVAAEVVRNAPASVLVVPPEAALRGALASGD